MTRARNHIEPSGNTVQKHTLMIQYILITPPNTNCRSTIHILFQPSAFPRRTFHPGCVKNIRMLQKPYNFHLPFKNFERKFASHRGFESQCVI